MTNIGAQKKGGSLLRVSERTVSNRCGYTKRMPSGDCRIPGAGNAFPGPWETVSAWASKCSSENIHQSPRLQTSER